VDGANVVKIFFFLPLKINNNNIKMETETRYEQVMRHLKDLFLLLCEEVHLDMLPMAIQDEVLYKAFDVFYGNAELHKALKEGDFATLRTIFLHHMFLPGGNVELADRIEKRAFDSSTEEQKETIRKTCLKLYVLINK
jgi:hypothetical protein